MPVLWGALLTLSLYAFEAIFGIVLSCFKKSHCVGIRIMAMNPFVDRFVPKFCHSKCDRSCGNWTCPKFHDDSVCLD